ncbi:NUDIX domain-containing protein [Amycolatopsis orientalis]|uniref:NUDIX domain-containing protein n=1 Tax=Amycolatopsis orientalis TaxID=31958 RepID=A0A193BYJ9_AMYOR|nr:NUDIX domain-containing protein [Amycolatopsis orientalis]ANN17245.1 NUDIX domain-containing protein [Amycolatopsis orientalis]
MPTTTTEPRVGARVLLLDAHDRVLLIHARDPDDPAHHWWELPGGGLDNNETLTAAAQREVAEESGIVLTGLDRKLWTRESRFTYRGQQHHRLDHVFLAKIQDTSPTVSVKPTANERAGLIERRWFTAAELDLTVDKLLPATLPALLNQLLAGHFPAGPIRLTD